MFDCTTPSYDSLYARWLEKPGSLLDWGGYNPRKHTRLLDLCGGTGAISKEALRRGAKQVTLLDLNPRVNDPRIQTIDGRAEDLRGSDKYDPLAIDGVPTNRFGLPLFNFVVCRQALGYLDLPKVARGLHEVMEPGAFFVCNTFVKPKWSIKPYRFQGRWFLEASGYIGRRVFHLQAARGDCDVTAFRWQTSAEILSAFRRFQLFNIEESGPSLKFQFRR